MLPYLIGGFRHPGRTPMWHILNSHRNQQSGHLYEYPLQGATAAGRQPPGASVKSPNRKLRFSTLPCEDASAAPKGVPAAVLDPVPEMVIFLNYYDKNYQPTVQSFRRISSAGHHSGGAAAPGASMKRPTEHQGCQLLYEDDSAAPEGRPGGGSGTCTGNGNFPELLR
jgi:hypothetical protein